MKEGPPLNYTQLLPCRWGWFVGLKSDPFQTGSVLTLGEYAPNEVFVLQGFLRRGDTVVDVGANVGNMMLAFAATVGPRGRVICFEPQRFPFMCLCANIALNSLMHYVEAQPYAVGEALGQIEVPMLNPMQHITNFGGVSLLDEHTTPTEAAPLITIDSLALPSLRLLKVDVEGMELQVLRGAQQTINRLQPVLWFEQLQTRGNRVESAAFLKEFGYRGWLCCTSLFSPTNALLSQHDMFALEAGSMQDHNVLALPSHVTPPEFLKGAEEIT
jgi:FkbM family methyltransferase